MNGKTEQPVTNEPRCTAAGGHAEIINVPGYPLMVRAVDYNALRAQLAEAQKDAERWRRAAQCARLDQFGGFVVTPDEPAFASEVSLAFTREIDVAIDAAKGEPT